ncbi:hypothetical protein NK718_20215 [Alsobacter sp. SYSU M60028]|uniref:Secreted protein n=1 Tax=Alsobacter ponti TaxID=2962936 RepID=A0ABT1LIA3_9HYPH|nr:hypothetical protein [Alsobacter ponti]MCP8940858.1 hypothetical protein [Alsobacter ponti]
MSRAILAAILTLAAAPALAQSRPDTLTMTCAQTQALVKSKGSIVLGSGQFFYDLYVASVTYCPIGEVTRVMFVKTKDQPACPLSVCDQPFQNY